MQGLWSDLYSLKLSRNEKISRTSSVRGRKVGMHWWVILEVRPHLNDSQCRSHPLHWIWSNEKPVTVPPKFSGDPLWWRVCEDGTVCDLRRIDSIPSLRMLSGGGYVRLSESWQNARLVIFYPYAQNLLFAPWVLLALRFAVSHLHGTPCLCHTFTMYDNYLVSMQNMEALWITNISRMKAWTFI